jgi:hypothetical protein
VSVMTVFWFLVVVIVFGVLIVLAFRAAREQR